MLKKIIFEKEYLKKFKLKEIENENKIKKIHEVQIIKAN